MGRNRAGIILVENKKMALIKRIKKNQTYYVLPGGGLEKEGSYKEAAIREAKEELGIVVEIDGSVREDSGTHCYFYVRKYSGKFATGKGEEFSNLSRGEYFPCWVDVHQLEHIIMYP
ncbi:8-oxo-dGTP pyrophosphatase MutT (NUDIX family) [Bacillus pakistanensis]|uniref:8-oxo-dGTP pyrophosphatase MutT (NUDIX family) n=1 Tax=Rossellomorea pakistanensis TaxID=992288 RepID=A0ABS2N8K8_9BACI|nr:NUDIX domain-containing protein [Bacillus pakistanensis]MBM7584196.1 8-oxo-dGTP pyrophosphatase MutT (NUDIX family) [Bacillus pakistanensis]